MQINVTIYHPAALNPTNLLDGRKHARSHRRWPGVHPFACCRHKAVPFLCRLDQLAYRILRRLLVSLSLVAAYLFVSVRAGAQPVDTVSLAVEVISHRAFLWKHTPRLTIRAGHVVFGQEVGLIWPTYGRRIWEAWRRYPLWGISLCYFRPGVRAHGEAWGIVPHLTIPLWRSRSWLTAFRIGTGIGYVTHPYDSFNNPAENAIGSYWNNLTQFQLGLTCRLTRSWRLRAGAALTHLSNGAAKLPNFGINLPSCFFSILCSPVFFRREAFLPASAPNRAMRRFGMLIGGSFARIEYAVVDGPKYAVWGASLSGLFHIDNLNRLTFSLESEYNPAVAEFSLLTGGALNVRAARSGAVRLALAPGAEFLFGPIGIHVQAGIYAGSSNINRYVAAPWYSRLTIRSYFPALPNVSIRPWVGISLKAHGVNAELIALQLGVAY